MGIITLRQKVETRLISGSTGHGLPVLMRQTNDKGGIFDV